MSVFVTSSIDVAIFDDNLAPPVLTKSDLIDRMEFHHLSECVSVGNEMSAGLSLVVLGPVS